MQHHHDADEPKAKPPLDYAAERYRGYPDATPLLEPWYVSIKEASRLCGDSPVTIYRKIAAGKLIAVKSGTKTLLEMETLKKHYTELPRFIGKTGQAA